MPSARAGRKGRHGSRMEGLRRSSVENPDNVSDFNRLSNKGIRKGSECRNGKSDKQTTEK